MGGRPAHDPCWLLHAQLQERTCLCRSLFTRIDAQRSYSHDRHKEKRGGKGRSEKNVDMVDNNNTRTPPASHAPVPSCHVMRKTRSQPRRHAWALQQHCSCVIATVYTTLDIFNMMRDGNYCIEFQSQQTTFQLLYFDFISLISCQAANENNKKTSDFPANKVCFVSVN